MNDSKSSKNFFKNFKNKWGLRRLFVILGLFTFSISFIAVFLISNNLSKSKDDRSYASANLADYAISIPTNSYTVGDTVVATITLTPNNNVVSAADLFITYDPSHLELSSAAPIAPLEELVSSAEEAGIYRLAFVVN